MSEQALLSTQPEQAPQPTGYGVVGWLRWGWRTLTSMRTALILLFLLAIASVPGSVLPQRGLNVGRVLDYYKQHPHLAPWLNRFSLFDVFASPWFAAIYLLLFTSLAGCVIPRSWRHARAMRAKPPAPPRNLERLPYSDSWVSPLSPTEARDAAYAALRKRHFRLTSHDEAAGPALAAEKGYLRETGNLVFHLALLLLLFGVALGSLYGYKATRLVVEGSGFSNSVGSFDGWKPGRFTNASSLAPFTVDLDRFHATYLTSGPNVGEPQTFDAYVRYRGNPGDAWRTADIRVNHPLVLGGTKVYLTDHGYAPVFRVRDGQGHVVYDGPVPFLHQDRNWGSTGVVKVPDARPTQLGFSGLFLPTAVRNGSVLVSAFPAASNPAVLLLAFDGNLGLDSGVPQSVYTLDMRHLHRLARATLAMGTTMRLPDGKGSITFTGVRQWASFQVTYDPGKRLVLGAAVLMIAGLLLSLRIRRRRVWVRVGSDDQRRTVVAVGGLGRTDGGAFTPEFADLTTALRNATSEE